MSEDNCFRAFVNINNSGIPKNNLDNMDAIHTHRSKKTNHGKVYGTNTLKNVYEEQNVFMLYIKTI